MPDREDASRAEIIAGYKCLLRSFLERRPSGLRGRLAMALGKHKSFVSQIANPAYTVPIPAGDLPIIFEICHLSPQEREGFLALYRRAHPERSRRLPAPGPRSHELRIAVPEFRSRRDRARGRGVDPRPFRPHHPAGPARRGGPRRRRQER